MDKMTSQVRDNLLALTQAERAEIAKSLGIPFPTVQKIAIGTTPDPRVSTWLPLAKHFGVVKKAA